jgi:hypothetical protein
MFVVERREVYVSQPTGEAVQDTTRRSRLGAYFGAIPHWIYFRQLRSNASLWTRVVIWLSGTGTLMRRHPQQSDSTSEWG